MRLTISDLGELGLSVNGMIFEMHSVLALWEQTAPGNAPVLAGWTLTACLAAWLAWFARHQSSLRRQAEKIAFQFASREKLFNQALYGSQMVIWEWDMDSDRLKWSENCSDIYGRADCPVTGAQFKESMHPEDRLLFERSLQSALSLKTSFVSEFRIARPDGTLRWMSIVGVSNRGAVDLAPDTSFANRVHQSFPALMAEKVKESGSEKFAGIAQDITARKKIEEVLMTLNTELEQRVSARTSELAQALEREKELGTLKSRFVSMASHEFRTPLTAIQASSDLLKHYGDRLTSEQRQERLEKIQSEVRNMTLLLEDVLFVGKADANRIEFRPEPVDFANACQELCLEMKAALRCESEIEFTTNRAGILVPTDIKLLRHIVTNLLSNAVKYSHPGAPVGLNLQFEEHEVTMTVTDRGIGIPLEDQSRLFESFHRAANVTDIPGTGLGLTIVKKSVELHGGRIQIQSTEGQGSSFTVTLGIPASLQA